MTIYIAFLRGINVGGKNVIKMADLKQTLQSLGLSKVQTYIQSGNVLFESAEEERPLREKIEKTIHTVFGFSVAVILRTFKELEQIVESCPFSDEEVSLAQLSIEVECLYIALLERAPLPEAVDRINVYKSETDQYQVIGREIYLLFHHSIRESKLAANLDRLGITMTVRNWRTIHKLADLARTKTV